MRYLHSFFWFAACLAMPFAAASKNYTSLYVLVVDVSQKGITPDMRETIQQKADSIANLKDSKFLLYITEGNNTFQLENPKDFENVKRNLYGTSPVRIYPTVVKKEVEEIVFEEPFSVSGQIKIDFFLSAASADLFTNADAARLINTMAADIAYMAGNTTGTDVTIHLPATVESNLLTVVQETVAFFDQDKTDNFQFSLTTHSN
jgi:hypothetical protein